MSTSHTHPFAHAPILPPPVSSPKGVIMTYLCELGNGQRIYLAQSGDQTQVTIASSSSGQQQQATSNLTTGNWTAAPEIFRTTVGIVIRLKTAQGEPLICIQGSSLTLMNDPSVLSHAQSLSVRASAEMPKEGMSSIPPMRSMEPMQSIEPMQPMTMGNMQMSLKPMTMRMGNLEMRMGESIDEPAPTTSSQRRFCTQCGAATNPNDRFCGSCGYQLY